MSTALDTYDVVIVGGGLAGAIVARRLAEAAQRVVVMEAQGRAGGSAARGAGLALLGTPEPYSALQTRLGAVVAQQIWELTRENLAYLSQTLEASGLPIHRVGSRRVAEAPQEVQQLEQSAKLLHDQAYSVTMEAAHEQNQLAALYTKDDIAYKPAALVAALLKHPNITLETEAEVQAIKQPSATSTPPALLTIWARKRYLRARRVVLAGGAHALHLGPALRPLLRVVQTHCLDLAVNTALPTPLILSGGQIVALAEGEGWRVAAWTPQGEPNAWPGLLEKVKSLCPQAIVRDRHSGWVAASQDGLPIIGALPEQPNVYHLNGLGPWGASWAFVAAERLAALLLQQQDPGVFSIQRFL
ncbi:MAG TPA: FAD-dependent oxidoreductase [Anaerolineae bacterium]|nr:FAD-dependent oxidoreductase [Anaerolineae bacterium]